MTVRVIPLCHRVSATATGAAKEPKTRNGIAESVVEGGPESGSSGGESGRFGVEA